MNNLNHSCTTEQLNAALQFISGELSDRGGDLFDLWIGDSYKGTTVSKNEFVDLVNCHIDLKNAEIAAHSQEVKRLNDVMEGATPAVLLDKFGKPVCEVKTTTKSGNTVTVAGGVLADGTPVNTVELKVSRAKKAFKAELECLSANLDKFGNVFYR